MIFLELLALAYVAFLLSNSANHLVMLYERARAKAPTEHGAQLRYLPYIGQLLIEAAANLLVWVLWPFKLAERAQAIRPVAEGEFPVLFVHGYHGSSGQLLPLRARLHGFGIESTALYSYKTTAGSIEEMAIALSNEVERLKLETAAEKVDLVGHSLGGVVCHYYVGRLDGAANVRTVVTIASPFHGTRLVHLLSGRPFRLFHPEAKHLEEIREAARQVASVRFVSIYSTDDNIVIPGESSALEGFGTNHVLSGLGHNSMLLSGRVALLVGQSLHAGPPADSGEAS